MGAASDCHDAAGGTPDEGSPSDLPTVDRLLDPVLRSLADGNTHEISAVVDSVANGLRLSAASRALRTKSGSTVLENRVGWVRTSLVRAGLVDQPRASTMAITQAGQVALGGADSRIDVAFLRRECPGYANWTADMGGELPGDEATGAADATVWMVRAGVAAYTRRSSSNAPL